MASNSAIFHSGDRVRIREDHWTGQGVSTGVVIEPVDHRGRVLVRMDDGVLTDIYANAIEHGTTPTRRLHPRSVYQNPPRAYVHLGMSVRKGWKAVDAMPGWSGHIEVTPGRFLEYRKPTSPRKGCLVRAHAGGPGDRKVRYEAYLYGDQAGWGPESLVNVGVYGTREEAAEACDRYAATWAAGAKDRAKARREASEKRRRAAISEASEGYARAIQKKLDRRKRNPAAQAHRIDTPAGIDRRTGKRAGIRAAQARIARAGEYGWYLDHRGWYRQDPASHFIEVYGREDRMAKAGPHRHRATAAQAAALNDYVASGRWPRALA